MPVCNMKLLVIVTLLALTCAQDLPQKRPVKRSYVCPPNFVRQGHRCYFFSKEPATWQEAHFHCRDMHSNIAVIKSANQDKLIRSFLSKKPLAPLERWLGGVYDWEQMAWKWAASGKPLSYSGFQKTEKEDKEKLRWHCIIMDPSLQYRWNSRSCVEQKHYICHTKLKTVNSKGKKKLRRQYNVDKDNKLNEIPVPTILDYPLNDTAPLKANIPITYKVEINQRLNDQALFAEAAPPFEKSVKRAKRKRKAKQRELSHYKRNSTISELSSFLDRERRRKPKGKSVDRGKATAIQHIRWRTYKRKQNNPLYPKPIVEEYNYVKER